MKNRRRVLSWYLWVAALLMGLAIELSPAPGFAADPPQQTAKKEGDVAAHRRDIIQGPHVEGHIAFLHAELGITPEQESLWAPLAAAMREDVNNLENTQDKVDSQTHGRLNAVQYLQNRVLFAQIRAQGEARFLAALKPLYNNFSDQQKRIADELLIPKPDEHP